MTKLLLYMLWKHLYSMLTCYNNLNKYYKIDIFCNTKPTKHLRTHLRHNLPPFVSSITVLQCVLLFFIGPDPSTRYKPFDFGLNNRLCSIWGQCTR